MTSTTLVPDDTATPTTTRRRFFPWIRQAHVAVAFLIFSKLIWFNLQLDVRFASPAVYVVTAGTVLLLCAPTALLGHRSRVVAVLGLDLAVSLLILADLVYYRYFFGIISVATLQQSSQTGAVTDSILSLVSPWDAVLFIDVVVALVFLKARGRDAFLKPVGQLRSGRSKELTVFAVVIGLTLVAVPVEAQRRGGDAFNSWWDMATYQFTGLVGFHAYDLGRYARQEYFQPDVTPHEERVIDEYFGSRMASPLREGMPALGEFAGTNVIVLQVEALQSMVLDREIGGTQVTPHLDRLSRDSLTFENFYHQASQGRTADAELLVDCSLQPAKFGTAFFRYADDDFTCLPESLQDAGYTTSVHHAYQGSFWNRNAVYPALGYDDFYTIKDYRLDEKVGWSLGDKSFLIQAADQLEDRELPFYAKLVTLTSHHPYALPTLDPDLDVGSLKDTVLGDYLRSIHYTDAALGDFLGWFESSSLADDTILVLYGDHDSGIYDDQLLDGFAPTSTSLESDLMQRSVPLMMSLPGEEYDGVSVGAPTGQIDVAPMLVHLLGVPTPGAMLGSDRLTTTREPVVFRDGTFIDDDYLYTPDPRCVRLSTGEESAASECERHADRAITQLRVSDLLLDHDLMSDRD